MIQKVIFAFGKASVVEIRAERGDHFVAHANRAAFGTQRVHGAFGAGRARAAQVAPLALDSQRFAAADSANLANLIINVVNLDMIKFLN